MVTGNTRPFICRWTRITIVFLVICWCGQHAGANEGTDLRAQRVAKIKKCTHGPDEPCPHGQVWYVDNQAPKASDDNDGCRNSPFKTINHAAQLALPGDTVLVADGVYREHVSPAHSGYDLAHMITYTARNRHKATIKGSEVWRPTWNRVEFEGARKVWQADLDPALFTYDFPIENFNPFALSGHGVTTMPKDLYEPPGRPHEGSGFPEWVRGMIFVDGELLRQVDNIKDFAGGSNVYFVSRDGKSVYARLWDDDPPAHDFEITTREQVFAPKKSGVGFVYVKGFVMEHAATPISWAQYGLISPNSSGSDGWHWIIEDNIIRWSYACGMDIGNGHWVGRRTRERISEEVGQTPKWSHWIKGNQIVDNGQAGVWSMTGSNYSIIEYNRIERNGWLNNIHMVEAAGIKMHGVTGVVIRGNLVRDNDNFGIWLDVTRGNNRVTQNLLLNNMTAGVFIEGIWGHTLVDNNISTFTRTFSFHQMNMGDGFYSHQASRVTFAHNLSFANTGYGYRCLMWGLARINTFPEGQCLVSHNRVLNNIAYANGRGAICLPMEQPYCTDNFSDRNFIWGPSSQPLFELGRAVIQPSKLLSKVKKAMKKAKARSDQVPLLTDWKNGQMGPNVGDMRHYGPLVGLSVWQAAEGWDLNSVVGPLPILWLTRAGQMRIRLDIEDVPIGKCPGDGPEAKGALPGNYRQFDQVKCQAIPEIMHDYFGHPRTNDTRPTVGPFQDLEHLGRGQKQQVFLHLWPLDQSIQPPIESLRLNRPDDPELNEQERAAGKLYMEEMEK